MQRVNGGGDVGRFANDDAESAESAESPERPPDGIELIFGDRTPLARTYAASLATEAVRRGLIGPREPSRIWTRHILNCVALRDLVPRAERIVDIGSGAGLPGVALALARPDLRVDLIESLDRRVSYLRDVVATLELTERVRVVHGRAEESRVRSLAGSAGCVTARAVAPLPRLLAWCAGLLSAGGSVALLKGASAATELSAARAGAERAGWRDLRVVTVRLEDLDSEIVAAPVVTATWCGRPSPRGGRRRSPSLPTAP